LLNWHRLFGIGMTDLFTGTGYAVELEKDLSIKQQFLDVVVIKKEAETGDISLPDGLDNLAAHNLITYKSLHEALNRWALDELISHFVNYRKLVADDTMLPYEAFALYAVTTRFPRKLTAEIDFEEILPGVLEVKWGTGKIRIIVLKKIDRVPRNAFWLLFSAQAEKFLYANRHIRLPDDGKINLIVSLNQYYRQEGIEMPYTIEDYNRDAIKLLGHDYFLRAMTPEQRLQGLDPEQRLQGLTPEQRIRGLEVEQLLQGLGPDELNALKKKILEESAEG